ncbi:hypothetical protein DPMN_042400 [Dreissena polymorpha]|uniref:Uncharacterized protein n=1 Tax=Dreissena polymorpha TaxID=45954 RepID=A0A9D4CZ09_DREPO|nr:hypothetical protein DPMN_042400 [Dreissena polymorpha]
MTQLQHQFKAERSYAEPVQTNATKETNVADWCQQANGVRQGGMLPQDLFNIDLLKIKRETLEGIKDNGACVHNRTIDNLRISAYIGLVAELCSHVSILLDILDSACSSNGQVISFTKSSKSRGNAAHRENTTTKGSFKYLCST